MSQVRVSRTIVSAAALLAGCAITQVSTPSGGRRWLQKALVETVEFDHACKAEGIVVLREYGGGGLTPPTACDLNVCGQVRRYKRVGWSDDPSGTTWLDVTSLYPPGSLPPLK